MTFCKRCGSVWIDKCTNPHCGKHVKMWAKEDSDYNSDLKENKPLIHAKRYNSENVQSMGLYQQENFPKIGYRLTEW